MARNYLYKPEVKILASAIAQIGDSRLRQKLVDKIGEIVKDHLGKTLVGDNMRPKTLAEIEWQILCSPALRKGR